MKIAKAILTGIPALSLALIAALVLFEVISRYALQATPLGIEELAIFFAVWAFFMGSALASKDKDHITVDFLEVFNIPERVKRSIKVVAEILTLLCFMFFLYYSIDYSIWVSSTKLNISPFGWPYLLAVLSMNTGLFFMCLFTFTHLIRRIRK